MASIEVRGGSGGGSRVRRSGGRAAAGAKQKPRNKNHKDGEVEEQGDVERRLVSQLEFYFSPANLLQDKFLQQHMDREGYVAAALVATFKKLQRLFLLHPGLAGTQSRNAESAGTSYSEESRNDRGWVRACTKVLLRLARKSPRLEVGSLRASPLSKKETGNSITTEDASAMHSVEAIRSRTQLSDLRDDSLRRKVFVEGVPVSLADHEKLGEVFQGIVTEFRHRNRSCDRAGGGNDGSEGGAKVVLHVSLPRDKVTRKFKGFAFIEFAAESDAAAAVEACRQTGEGSSRASCGMANAGSESCNALNGARVMSKREWLQLKGKYSALMATSLPRVGLSRRDGNANAYSAQSNIQQSGTGLPSGNPEESTNPASNGVQSGSVVRLFPLGASTSRKALRAACQLIAPVSYVEYHKDASAESALVRFKTRIGATLAVRHFRNQPQCFGGEIRPAAAVKLPPKEEMQYLEQARLQQEKFFKQRQAKKEGKPIDADANAPKPHGANGVVPQRNSAFAAGTKEARSFSSGTAAKATPSTSARGTVLQLQHFDPATTRKQIRAWCQAAGPDVKVGYVDYEPSKQPEARKKAIVRFASAAEAARVLEHLQSFNRRDVSAVGDSAILSPQLRVAMLPEDEERRYLELARLQQEEFFRMRKQKQKRKCDTSGDSLSVKK
eukprot:INCI20257.1.p1 GENE.INCI20257.1~~INCI20257.1.p1  ORF type:complete len:669 (+),score=128.43 INCI20257.1:117-2123(+)